MSIWGKKKKKTVTSYIRISLKGHMELKIKAYIVKLTDRNIGKVFVIVWCSKMS